MASPLFGTDPLSGASYPFGGQLKSSHRNNLLAWQRNLDLAIEQSVAQNWPTNTTLAGITITGIQQMAFDASDNAWMIVGNNAGAPEVQVSYDGVTWTSVTPAAGGAADAKCVASDGSGTWVVGCDDGTVRRTTNLGSSWTSPAPGGADCQSIFWDDVNSQFILSEGGQGTSRSSDGTTWTRQATGYPAGFAGKTVTGGCTNQSDLLVVTCNNHNECATSEDGITWVARSMPLSGDYTTVCWSTGFSKFFANDGNIGAGGLVSSSNGTSWSSVSVTLPFTASLDRVTCTGNLLVAAANGATDYIVVSSDQGENWEAVLTLVTNGLAVVFGASASNGGRLGAIGTKVHLSHSAAL